MRTRADWQRVPIKKVYEGLYDGPHATPAVSDNGPVFLGIGNITDDGHLNLENVRHIAEEDFPRWTKRVTPAPGDIVFTYEATLNRYAVIPPGFRGCLGRRLALIRPDSEVVDTRFLHYYFFGREWRETIEANKLSGATVDRIPLSDFPNFQISLPPLSTQRRIASILSAYDDLIENNTRRIAILEEMARRLYEEWFVHFRFPGYEEAGFHETELGQIPEGWEVETVSDAAELVMGQSPKSEYYNTSGEGLPFHQGVADFGTFFPKERLYCSVTNRVAEEGDILFSVRAPVGRINIATTRIVIGRGVAAIRSKRRSQTFLLSQLRNQFQELDSMGGGTIFKAVTKKEMQSIPLLRPASRVVDRFEALASSMWKQIRLLADKNTNLRTQRDLLLPKLVSGEIDVSDMPLPDEEDAAA